MARNWSREELLQKLQQNPGLRVAADPLERAAPEKPPRSEKLTLRFSQGGPPAPAPRKESHTPQNDGHTQPDWLEVLMRVPQWRARLDPEAALSVACATELRRLSLAGQLRCVWSRIPGEHEQGGRIGAMHQAKRACMGHVPGVPDYFFAWATGAGLVELKVSGQQTSMLTPTGLGFRSGRKTYQSKTQRLWQCWAESCGVPVVVVRSVPELRTTLQGWGVLTC